MSASRTIGGPVSSALLALWAGITGVAPHVLHHVGLLAGAAFLAGIGGRLLFAGIALAVSVPFLLRLHKRFGTWVAPAIALMVMAVMFSLSTFVIGPAISSDGSGTERPAHDEHGHRGTSPAILGVSPKNLLEVFPQAVSTGDGSPAEVFDALRDWCDEHVSVPQHLPRRSHDRATPSRRSERNDLVLEDGRST